MVRGHFPSCVFRCKQQATWSHWAGTACGTSRLMIHKVSYSLYWRIVMWEPINQLDLLSRALGFLTEQVWWEHFGGKTSAYSLQKVGITLICPFTLNTVLRRNTDIGQGYLKWGYFSGIDFSGRSKDKPTWIPNDKLPTPLLANIPRWWGLSGQVAYCTLHQHPNVSRFIKRLNLDGFATCCWQDKGRNLQYVKQ